MLDHILITPDNRLLAFSTHDFSLYGGQTPVEMRVGLARPIPVAPPKEAPDTREQASDPADLQSQPFPDLPQAPDMDAVPPVEPSQSGIASTVTDLGLGAPASFIPAVPAPVGSGSVAPIQTSPLMQQSGEMLQNASLADNIPGPLPQGPAADLQDLTGLVLTQLPLAQAGDALGSTIEAVAAPVTGIAHLATPIVAPVLESVGDVAEPVGSLAAAAVDSVEGVVAAPLDAATSGPLADAAQPLVEDTLDGVLGADPPGGIATLVSLVSVGDVFDVGESTSADTGAQPAAPDLLDTLAADLPADDALLGNIHHDDSPLGDEPHADPLVHL